jgi:zinc/manganese transport system ATP-binding protein/zinc transport system ATP-binding protein
MQPIISLQNITCGYDGHTILSGVSVEIAAGAFVGLVGPSGSGKTTVLRTLLGQVRPTAGRVTINGVTLTRRGQAAPGLAYVPQLETVDWDFPITVEQAVLMGRIRAMGWLPWPNATDKQQVTELLERLGLARCAHHSIRQLSGGQQQRVFLARALISNPQILLLDEPTSGIDVKTRGEVLALLREINAQGITVLLTTHELTAVAATLPEVICIRGRVVAHGAPEAVFTPEVLTETYHAPMRVFRHEGQLLVAEA